MVRSADAVQNLYHASSGRIRLSIDEFDSHIRPLLKKRRLWLLYDLGDVDARLAALCEGVADQDTIAFCKTLTERIKESQDSYDLLKKKGFSTGGMVVIEETELMSLDIKWIIQVSTALTTDH